MSTFICVLVPVYATSICVVRFPSRSAVVGSAGSSTVSISIVVTVVIGESVEYCVF